MSLRNCSYFKSMSFQSKNLQGEKVERMFPWVSSTLPCRSTLPPFVNLFRTGEGQLTWTPVMGLQLVWTWQVTEKMLGCLFPPYPHCNAECLKESSQAKCFTQRSQVLLSVTQCLSLPFSPKGSKMFAITNPGTTLFIVVLIHNSPHFCK